MTFILSCHFENQYDADPSAVAKFQRAAAWNSLIAGIQSHLVSSREPSQLSSGLNLRQEPSLVQTHISFRNLGQSSSGEKLMTKKSIHLFGF